MTDQGNDKELEAYLRGDSPVSRRYAELGADEPSAGLDAAILGEARDAASSNVFPLKPPPRHWMVPVTLVATVILSFSLVMSVVFDTSRLVDGVPATMTESYEVQAKRSPESAIDGVLEGGLEGDLEASDDLRVLSSRFRAQRPAETPPSENEMNLARSEKKEQVMDETVGFSAAAPEPAVVVAPPAVAGKASAPAPARSADRESPAGLFAALAELAPETRENAPAQSRQREAGRQDMPASLAAAEALADADAGQATVAPDPAQDLERVMALIEAGDEPAALAALEAFTQTWPEHPATRLYLDWLEQNPEPPENR